MCELMIKPVPQNPYQSWQRGWAKKQKITDAARKHNLLLCAAPTTYCNIPVLKGRERKPCGNPACKRVGCMGG